MIERSIHKINNEIVLAKLSFEPPFEANPETLKNEARIIYVVRGKSVLRTPISSFQLSKGDCVIINSGNIVNNWIENEDAETAEVILFRLFPELIKNIYSDLSTLTLQKSERNEHLVSAYKINAHDVIEKFIEGIRFYFDTPELLGDELISVKIRELIFLLERVAEDSILQFTLKNMFNPIEYKFSEIINANIFENIQLTELAHLSGLSLSSFNRKFKRIYKESPKKYILRKRLERAKALLSLSELRIAEIGYECGFDDPANFTKSFSSLFGLSPTDYRKSSMA